MTKIPEAGNFLDTYIASCINTCMHTIAICICVYVYIYTHAHTYMYTHRESSFLETENSLSGSSICLKASEKGLHGLNIAV